MRKTLADLGEAAKELNAKTDELNEVISDFEDALQEAGVGLTVWLRDLLVEDVSGGGDLLEGYQLGYTKVGSEWRVAVRYGTDKRVPSGGGGDVLVVSHWEFTPTRSPEALAKAPRVVRVQAAPLLEKLAVVLTEKMREYVNGIEAAKKAAKD